MSRRQALLAGVGALAAAGGPEGRSRPPAAAATEDAQAAIDAFTGGAEPTMARASCWTCPKIAENGNTVPMNVFGREPP